MNDSAGGAPDYSTPAATTSALTWASAPLAPSSDTTFAVRAYDTVTTLEDRNTDARARVLVGPAGEDLTGLPNAPSSLSARATAGGTAEVAWAYVAGGQGGAPTEFRVYAGTPTVSYTTPVETVDYVDDRTPYTATIASLSDGVTYQFSVRAANASGEESNAAVVAVTASTASLAPVTSLAATVAA